MPKRKTSSVDSDTFLIDNASNPSPKISPTRLLNFVLRERLRWVTDVTRVKKCGKVTHSPISLHLKGGKAYFKGFTTCGNVHLCPVCSSKILAWRTKEAIYAARRWFKKGGGIAVVTFTIPNAPGPLRTQLDGLQKCWEAVREGKAGQEFKKAFSSVGHLVTVETKYSKQSGWHPHLHIRFFFESEPDQKLLNEWFVKATARWIARAVKLGLGKASPQAQKLQVVQRSPKDFEDALSYAFKDAITGAEVKGLSGSLTMTEVLKGALDGDKTYLSAWKDYEKATYRKNKTRYSGKLKAALGIVEKSDGTILEEPYMIEITPMSVAYLTKDPQLQARILTAAELGGLEEAAWFMNNNGIDFNLS
ncbi:MAG: hypothetical protein RL343_248 [Actinomycetota bacterium]|jgi:hypothetical protein